ncbi:MAG: UDP-N-acetylmuramoyl-L-alanyl-D-glutamate--2,6-diaminopimelate ligase [Alphaproteobacteria bacterium]|nr:UDP-N-acetylmuramoyl-L-alanyl-D-glutamate--2,6-diaminopimelate ligase [Alphaproteobacteria bacterium]
MPPALLASGDPDIMGLTADSRDVRPGWLFAAIPGTRLDGRAYIDDALARGAVAVLTTPGAEARVHGRVPLLAEADPRHGLARMAAAFYTPQPKTLAAVTGTNGKTSVAEFTRQMWATLGHEAASLGTLGVTRATGTEGPSLTTPDPVRLHTALRDLARNGVDHAVIEASSHGLDQARLDGVTVQAAAFTNLSRDHLDYHGTVEAYRAAKLRLFDRVAADGTAVLNLDAADCPAFATAAAGKGLRILGYGQKAGAELRLAARHARPGGQVIDVIALNRARTVEVPLIGDFQAWNALAALGLVIATGTPVAEALQALDALVGVRGRMERVATLANGAAIYVDFAHTPDALTTMLRAVRPHTEGALWCVFGCGGDRDPGKRPMMGKAVADAADRPIVTDDNPRSENPAAIRAVALAACPGGEEIGGRAEAIATTIRRLGPGDVLVIAGKGHEQGQEIGGTLHPFDDASVARDAATAFEGASS